MKDEGGRMKDEGGRLSLDVLGFGFGVTVHEFSRTCGEWMSLYS